MKYLIVLIVLLVGCTPNRVVLDAPETAQPGQLVVLDATKSNVPVTWYSETDYEVIGKTAFFCPNELGEYTFILIADDRVIVHKIKVQLKVVSLIKDWLPKNPDSKIIEKLARSFERVALAGHTDLLTLVKTTAISNRAILGSDLEKWQPFLESLSEYLKENLQDKDIDAHTEFWFKIAAELRKINAKT